MQQGLDFSDGGARIHLLMENARIEKKKKFNSSKVYDQGAG